MKRMIICSAVLLYTFMAFTQSNLYLEFSGVKINNGNLYISLFNSEHSYKERKVYHSLVKNPADATISVELNLPEGEYLVSVYQDNNNNETLDTNLIGIPKEPFGFSNYDGKSVPGNFNRHKVLLNEKTKKISVQLFKL